MSDLSGTDVEKVNAQVTARGEFSDAILGLYKCSVGRKDGTILKKEQCVSAAKWYLYVVKNEIPFIQYFDYF